jgi:phosphoribosylamine---glycine ligase
MRALILDTDAEGQGLDLALRGSKAGHDMRYWLPSKGGATGDGLVEKVEEWEPLMDWAELIVLTGNSDYQSALEPYFARGYPIFGCNPGAAELELDRGVGQQAFTDHGIETLPYVVVNSANEAVDYIAETEKAYVLKPWGGASNKAMTYVARTPEDSIYTLQRWEREGLFQGQLMIQEKVDGIEMGVSGMFGPGGWCRMLEESFEHKKFMNDDLGCNTGEQGTIIRHTSRSALFKAVLAPLTPLLHQLNYVGDASVNCIIDKDGVPWPLEFTMRLGWPDFCIRQAVLKTDPLDWMLDLIKGHDTFDVSDEVAAGIVLTHGDYPMGGKPKATWTGYPIDGIEDFENIHPQQMMLGLKPTVQDGKVRNMPMEATSGTYVMVVSGAGGNVRVAAARALALAHSIKWPSNVMFRTDVGARLRDQLPQLHALGYAIGINYGNE